MRALEAQNLLFLHGLEHVAGEAAAVDAAHVQLEVAAVVRGVGDREAAPLTVGEQDVDVLAGAELEVLARRQLEVDEHDVVGQALQLLHARGQLLDRDVVGAGDVARLYDQVAQRLRAAEQGVALGALGLGQCAIGMAALIHHALQHLALARATGAVAATVRQQQPGRERGFEHGLVVGGLEVVVARA